MRVYLYSYAGLLTENKNVSFNGFYNMKHWDSGVYLIVER